MARPKQPRVLVIGELNVDIVAAGLKGPPRMGAEILAKSFALTLGSASAIFASGIAKLGHQVTFVSQTGADHFGDFCIEALEANGVSTEQVYRNSKARTGVTIALSSTRDRALVTYQGAIASFKAPTFAVDLLKTHDHLHMTSYFLQNALRPSFPKMLRTAQSLGLTTSFDPNSDPSSSWDKPIYNVFRHTDVLFLNRTEALELTGTSDVKVALKQLGRMVPCAVVKLGPNGAKAIQGTETSRDTGFKVKAVDTTGAGDTFDAGFVSAFLRRASLAQCLREANACGALSTLAAGGIDAQPTASKLQQFLRSSAQ